MVGFYNALINEIRRLYNQVSLAILHMRISEYHRHVSHGDISHEGDIKSSLLDYVNHLAKNKEPPQKVTFNADSIIPKHAAVNKLHYEKNHDRHHVTSHKYTGDLTKYFKSRRKQFVLQQGIKEKLEHSVWEHINASIQCAHKGDRRNAKMHIEIASTAYKEVAHYMPEDKYRVFCEKINQRLDVLKSSH